MNKHPVKAYSTANGERDTYELKPREVKELIPIEDIAKHWDIRAQRPGIQAVMSARHSLDENVSATYALQHDIFDFLGCDYVDGKKVFELGVGIGRMTSELVKRAREVVGCDLSTAMLARARESLKAYGNVKLYNGKITELDFAPKSFDLVFESIVLLHILNPEELKKTAQRMQELSDRIFIVEHTYEGPDFPISKYSILRKPEEYAELFAPYKLVKQKTHLCAGDTFTMMLFEK